MRPTRIICLGNGYSSDDDAGSRVYGTLVARGVPPGIDVLDGGLAGPDLLLMVEGATRVVFVDAVRGFGAPGDVMRLTREDVRGAGTDRWSHGAGLPYLLRLLEVDGGAPRPDIVVIGIEAPAPDVAIDRAAELALALAGERARFAVDA